jgi:ABC-type amino acid transport substrate-binding protein
MNLLLALAMFKPRFKAPYKSPHYFFFCIFYFCIAAISISTSLAQVPTPASTIKIGIWDQNRDPLSVANEAILKHAYAELKQPVKFIDLPIRRAMQMMLNNELDGNIFRTSMLKNHPDLIRIEPAIDIIEIRVYEKNRTYSIKKWADLKNLRVAFKRGTLIIEKNIPKNAVKVEASDLMDVLKLLETGAADIALLSDSRYAGNNYQALLRGFTQHSVILEETNLYHYLRKEHRVLAHRLSVVLKKMETTGESRAIRKKILAGNF